MSISQEIHDQINRLVTDNSGITSLEIINLVFSDRTYVAGKTQLQRIRSEYKDLGIYVWDKTGKGKILWYTASYAEANNIKGVDVPKRLKSACDSYFTRDDKVNLSAYDLVNRLMKPRVAA